MSVSGSFAGVAGAATATVTVSNSAVGVTPRFMGYNTGHYMPGSNTSAWTQYTGINAFRFWASPSDYEPTDDQAPFGDGVTSLSAANLTGFDFRKNALRADLRANPTSSTYVNWSYFNNNFDDTQTGRNKTTLLHALPELQKMGADVVMQITRSNAAAYQVNDWGGKWEQWQHYYAMAFHSARNYDVQRYQMYNEPDLDDISQSEWVLRLQLASDAVKSAIEDANFVTGKKLSWSMYAPVAASTVGAIDTAGNEWGRDALQANRTDYAGRPTDYDIFDTYDVHRYNSLGSSFASDRATFDTKIPLYNASGETLPVTYTEFNRYNSGTYSNRTDGPDTAQNAAEFGGIFPSVMKQTAGDVPGVKGLYAFKFSQTEWTSSTTGLDEKQKTGFYYAKHDGTTYNIMGSTRGAETYRLAVKAFKGERERFGQTVAGDSTYAAAGTIDPGRGTYYFYSANSHTSQTRTVTLNLDEWNVPGGSIISIQEVSGASYGAAKPSQFLTVPSSGSKVVTFTQPITSTWLLTAPTMTQTLVNLSATADAQISHATPTTNFGTLTTAKVERSATTTTDNAAYLKFNLGANEKARVGRAFLNVTGINTADTSPVHVYGITTDSWTETGINWNNAPNLAAAADALVTGVGTNAFPVGQLTWSNTAEEWGIEITEFVRKHPDLDLSFVLVRENRFDADPPAPGGAARPGDTDISRVTINTRENASGKPRLSLYLTENPTYFWASNFNANFTDITRWDTATTAPNAAGAVAVFGEFITSPHTVTMNAAATVGTVNFDNLNAYTISGSQILTMNGGASNAAINAYKGDHVIDTPVALTSAATVHVDRGSLTISKPITGAGAITKTGPGTLTLSGANTFGPTTALTISEGVVNVNGTMTKGVSVGTDGTLGGTGTVSGATAVNGRVAPGGVGVASSTPLTLNGGLTLNTGSTVDFDFAVGAADRIASSGSLTLSGGTGSVVLNLNDLGGLGAGDYTLIQHSNALANLNALAIGNHPAAGTYTLLNNAGAVVLHVTDIGNALVWRGNVNGTWNINTTANWAGVTSLYHDGDVVTFDDSATGSTTVSVATNVSPASVTFNNSDIGTGGKAYTITGPGGIGGGTGVTLNGTGTVTLNGTNNFSGALQLNNGTLIIGSSTAVTSASSIDFNGGTLAFATNATLGRPMNLVSSGSINTNGYNVTSSGAISGSAPLRKIGNGTLVLTTAAASFSGTTSIEGGTLRLNNVGAVGSGAISVSDSTLELNALSMTANAVTLNDGGILVASGGSSTYTKGNYPTISNDAINVGLATVGASDVLSIGSAIRNTADGESSANINVSGPGLVVLNSGGVSAGNTYSGTWSVQSGMLQLGPTGPSTSESLNALGFKNGDSKQANSIAVLGGTLVGAVNTPQSANAAVTPSFFRAGVTLAGGALASTGLNANFGGDFATQVSTISSVYVYDPLSAGTPRDVNLVGGAAGANNNAAATNWAGTLVVTPGALAVGGAFNINRTGGTIAVTPGAVLQINPGATVNLGGSADALSDGIDHVNILNNSTTSFNVTAGVKNIGSLGGVGASSVAAGATMTANHVRQGSLTVNGTMRIRANGSSAGVSNVTTVAIGAAGKLDLANNNLVTNTAIGTESGGIYSGVQGLVQSGLNSGGWDGTRGIITSQSDALTGLTTIGVATGAFIRSLGPTETDVWAGQTINGNSTLLMYTYAGDGNLDGFIDGTDYFFIDSSIATPGADGYGNGDFNYDGVIDGTDYFFIDSNISLQGAPFYTSAEGSLSVVAVPEPSSLAVIGLISSLLCRRRRRI